MNTLLRSSKHTAQKDYECNACLWLKDAIPHYLPKMTFGEYRSIVLARRDNYKVKKGMQYLRTTGLFEGDFYSCASRIEIDKICAKYNFYAY
jgi:hypothetical protein